MINTIMQPIFIEKKVEVCPTCRQELPTKDSESGLAEVVFLLIAVILVVLFFLTLPWLLKYSTQYIDWVMN